ncbi:uncharacterized protein LOC132630236 [Lycium barbarum]|uniref:uncharacterized protein LOC132630236 n=1 Tax=Lycium barbarum TaxID=112863 RepID=UPI00293E2218|nr:uncharacterized protein LOC132630236 [Lycium barbarum]
MTMEIGSSNIEILVLVWFKSPTLNPQPIYFKNQKKNCCLSLSLSLSLSSFIKRPTLPLLSFFSELLLSPTLFLFSLSLVLLSLSSLRGASSLLFSPLSEKNGSTQKKRSEINYASSREIEINYCIEHLLADTSVTIPNTLMNDNLLGMGCGCD